MFLSPVHVVNDFFLSELGVRLVTVVAFAYFQLGRQSLLTKNCVYFYFLKFSIDWIGWKNWRLDPTVIRVQFWSFLSFAKFHLRILNKLVYPPFFVPFPDREFSWTIDTLVPELFRVSLYWLLQCWRDPWILELCLFEDARIPSASCDLCAIALNLEPLALFRRKACALVVASWIIPGGGKKC